MLAVLRFWFTKDLVCFLLRSPSNNSSNTERIIQKYVKGKPCKPYNSTLGEFFRVCLSFFAAYESRLLMKIIVQLGSRR